MLIDLELRVGQGRPGRPAVHGVVLSGGLGHLDLAGDGGVLPLHDGRLACGDIDRFQLGIGDIALIFQLPQVVPPGGGQPLNINVPRIVGGVLPDRLVATVIQQEGHAINSLAGNGIRFVDENAAESLVGDGDSRGFSVLDGEVGGCGVQLESLSRLDLNRVEVSCVQIQVGAALFVRGHGIHQSAVHLSDLEGRVGDALGLVRLVDLDQLQTTCPLVVEGELLALGPFFNENALGRSIQDILLAWDPDLFCGNGGSGGEARQQDLSIPVRHILTLVGAERHTAGIGHQEGDTLQRLVFSALDILLDGQIHARDVVHGKRLRICGIYRDHLPLCSGINGESGQAPGFLDHDGSHNRNTNLATLIGRVEAQGGQVPIGVIHKLAGCVAQFELHPSQRLGSELVQFFDDEIPGRLIDKAERLPAFAALDLDALGGGVQHHAVRDLEFLCGNGDPRFQIGDDNTSVLPRDVFAVAAANDRPGAVGHEEGDTL